MASVLAGCATQKVDPGADDVVLVEDTGTVEPKDSGTVGPEDTGAVEPQDTGTVEPLDAGNGPFDTGNVTPADTGNGPFDTGNVTPADTGNVTPTDTGNGPTCPTGFTNCAGQCRPLLLDSANCGACGRACATGQQCLLGICSCSSGTTLCGGACTNTQTDGSNCGGCGRACAAGQQCIAGACQVVCASGQTMCAGACVNTQSDANHCGGCGVACLNGAMCTGGACVGGDVSGPTFQVVAPRAEGCRVSASHDSVTGDDRGGIAMGSSRLFYTGDTATGSFDPDTLGGVTSAGRIYDGLVTNFRSGQVFTLAVGTTPLGQTGGRVDGLIELNPTTGALGTNRIALSPPITVPSASGQSGIFSGWDRAVILTGGRAYNVNLVNGGTTNLGAVTFPTDAQRCENWAVWGFSEFFNNAVHVAYVRNNNSIARMRLPDGMVSDLAIFTSLSDMCSITLSPQRRRWYYHAEGTTQFGPGIETVGYCDAVINGPATTCPSPLSLCSNFCRDLRSDSANCGACGRGCPTGQVCANSACTSPCPSGQTQCGGACVDLQSNSANCGECGRACIGGQFCAAGNCQGGNRYTRSNSPASFVNACSLPGVTRVLASTDDGMAASTVPFAFRFWGTAYNAGQRIAVSTNGWASLTYTGTSMWFGPPTPPSAVEPNALFAVYYDDLYPRAAGICIATTGASPDRRYVIEWANISTYGSSNQMDFELILHESTGIIDMLYASMTGAETAIVALENQTGSLAVGGCPNGTASCTLPSNTASRFTPSP